MLDGKHYFAEFPDEEPVVPGRTPLTPELLTALMAIEREISGFILAGAAREGGQPTEG